MMDGVDSKVMGKNPILGMDFPDPDVIYVPEEKCFYMISTTMHFFPGGQILRSYDLVNWEHAAYVFETLDGTPGQRLTDGATIYGKGMWAGCLRYHEGMFYVAFSCNDTQKTYLYRAPKVEGPWSRNTVEGFYYDLSMLFDDGKVYMVHGHRDVYITELNDALTGPKEGGLHRLLISDKDNPVLGYEGSHIYKINGEYWLFNIHSLSTHWMRVEAAFHAKSLEEEFQGGDVLNFALADRPDGFAQGGVVEGPEGVWHAVLFRDNGAVGRIPVVVEVVWTGTPEGVEMVASEEFETTSLRPGHSYAPLFGSDDFSSRKLKDFWQFNHEPDRDHVSFGDGALSITTSRVDKKMTDARNTLTQRMHLPRSAAEVTIDASSLSDGDVCGLAAFQGQYCFVGLTKENGEYQVVFGSEWIDDRKPGEPESEENAAAKALHHEISARVPVAGPKIRVRLVAGFAEEAGTMGQAKRGADEAECFYRSGDEWVKIGNTHPLRFKLDHFTGCRFGLFCYSTEKAGGTGKLSDFTYVE